MLERISQKQNPKLRGGGAVSNKTTERESSHLMERVIMKNPIKLEEGEKLNRNPNNPVISIEHGYLWIGNNAPDDKACFATLSNKRTLLKLADRIRRAVA